MRRVCLHGRVLDSSWETWGWMGRQVQYSPGDAVPTRLADNWKKGKPRFGGKHPDLIGFPSHVELLNRG